ncbi:MAG: ATP-binding cassette domain-containing protein [Clostridia bacterium]|nr:ATP-binding cassette domain-containing protein [Clostridia bacterium]
MVNLVKTDYLTLSLFVLIIPYIYEVLGKSLNCLNFSSEINDVISACKRTNYILSLTSQNTLIFGDNNNDLIYGDLLFSSVSLNNQVSKINNFNACFVKKTLNCCVFNKTESLNLFIQLLSRKIKPQRGTITLDNTSIYDFSKEVYSHNISIVYKDSFFFDDSIMNNLKIVNNSKREIVKTLKLLDIYNEINDLNNGLQSKPSELKSSFTIFLLNLARAMLTNAEFIIIEDLSLVSNPNLLQKLNKILLKITKYRSVIICSTYGLNLTNCKEIEIN